MTAPKKRIIPFNYFGGKYNHLDFILKRLPETRSYIEVFGGSAVVLLNKRPSRIEAYNDIDSTVHNFFWVLRNHRKKLIDQIYLTPYSEKEYKYCFENMNTGDEVERARKFFVSVNQSFNGTITRVTGWKMSTVCSRALISEALNRWLSKIPNLHYTAERLKQVQLCNMDFRKLFEKFDDKQALFYCDPPYLHSLRSNNDEYEHELTENDHVELCEIACRIKGKIAISGYDNDLYNNSLKGFYKSIAKVKRDTMLHNPRQEVLWTNYDPDHINLNLFNH